MIESQVPRPHDRTVGGGLVSLLAHATILAAAVAATARTATVERQPYVHGPIVFVPVDESHDAPPARGRGAALPSAPFAAGVTLEVLSLPPVRIPPPAAGAFDPARFSAPPPPAGVLPAADTVLPATRVFSDRLVDERPELLSHPPLRYPEILKEAGIEGAVVLDAVVDTAGRIERGSVRIVTSTNALFDAAARETIAGSLYRPGRWGGRAVRVRVTQPVVFRLAGRSPAL